MKKVYVNIRSGEATKERFEAISPEYEFVYKEDLDAEVVIGHVPPSRLKEFKNLKWVQAPAVGIDRSSRTRFSGRSYDGQENPSLS